ncbi:hypothetical protein ECPA10_3345, partial [Escherichia coli PA10]
MFCYVFDQLPYKAFGNSQLNQWVSKAFLQDKALLQDNS